MLRIQPLAAEREARMPSTVQFDPPEVILCKSLQKLYFEVGGAVAEWFVVLLWREHYRKPKIPGFPHRCGGGGNLKKQYFDTAGLLIFNDLGPSIQSQLEIRLYHPINVDYLFSIIVTTLIEVELYF